MGLAVDQVAPVLRQAARVQRDRNAPASRELGWPAVRKGQWLRTDIDETFVRSLMQP
jgi:hypothetical protein